MKIMYLGDVMGGVGLSLVEQVLPKIRKEQKIDLVIAQAENVTDGRGISVSDYRRLLAAGVDFCSGGNWTLHLEEIVPFLEDPSEPIIRPLNYPEDTPGLGYKYLNSAAGRVLVVSLLGQVVGRDAEKPTDNPLRAIDRLLAEQSNESRVATIVNFHGDYSSEKVVIGHYLDGRVSAVIGDHWHVPTADARILTGGAGHITDVGMCGILDSSLGVTYSSVIPRWRDGVKTRNSLETEGPRQFNFVAITVRDDGLATSIQHFRRLF